MQKRDLMANSQYGEEVPVNMQMIKLLTLDMQEVMNKYILDWLIQKFSKEKSLFAYKFSRLPTENKATTISLNELVQKKRETVFAPVARYADEDYLGSRRSSNERISSNCTEQAEPTPISTKNVSSIINQNWTIITENENKSFVKPRRNKYKSKCSKTELAFDNEGGELATRCDVVYKTILRDFRRFYLDDFKSSNCSISHGLGESIIDYTKSLFSLEESSSSLRLLSLELGCLLFPKEILKNEILFNYISNKNRIDFTPADVKSKVTKIHGFLYKFSIDKVEECFQNKSMCRLFFALLKIRKGKNQI